MALQNFVDQVGPIVLSAWLNPVDQAINGNPASGQGAYLIPAKPSTGLPGANVGAQLDEASVFIATVGSSINSYSAGNRIINSALRINQRFGGSAQTVIAGAAAVYCADRFYISSSANNITTGNSGGRLYFSNSGSATAVVFGQKIELASIFDLVGQTCTLGIGLSVPTGGTLSATLSIYNATSPDNWTFGRALVGSTNITLTTTQTIFPYTFIPPSPGALNGLSFELSVPSLGSGQTVYVTQPTLTPGSIVYPFQSAPIANEILACNRFYAQGTARLQAYGAAGGINKAVIQYPTQMHAAPTVALGTLTSTNVTSSAASEIDITQFSFTATSTALGAFYANQTWAASSEL